jgi:hypothetical protein
MFLEIENWSHLPIYCQHYLAYPLISCLLFYLSSRRPSHLPPGRLLALRVAYAGIYWRPLASAANYAGGGGE